jgi:hypothetical protein
MKRRLTSLSLVFTGLAMIVFTAYSFAGIEKVVELGPMDVNLEKNYPFHWLPIVGGAMMVFGIVLGLLDKKRV